MAPRKRYCEKHHITLVIWAFLCWLFSSIYICQFCTWYMLCATCIIICIYIYLFFYMKNFRYSSRLGYLGGCFITTIVSSITWWLLSLLYPKFTYGVMKIYILCSFKGWFMILRWTYVYIMLEFSCILKY